jgi:hypothetical protein
VSIDENPQLPRDAHHLIRFYCDLDKFTPAFKETILRVEANNPTLTEINFERRGNTDEKTIFDDTSMRLLCAALPHNIKFRCLFIRQPRDRRWCNDSADTPQNQRELLLVLC